MGASPFQAKVESAIMFVRKGKLSPSVFLAHAKVLENSTAKYPIRRAVCKTVTIPNTFPYINVEKLFSGQLLSRLVIGLIANAAFNSTNDRNPFNFAHFNLMEISVYSDGLQQYGMKPLTTDFTNSLYVRAFNILFSGTGKVFKDEGGHHSLRDMRCTPDLAEEDHFNP